MPIMYCSNCHFPVPDSFHDFKKICVCLPKKTWIHHARLQKWMLRLDGEVYDFTGKTSEEKEQ